MHKSEKLLYFCLFFLGGVFTASLWPNIYYGFIIAIIFYGIIKNFRILFLLLCVAAFWGGGYYLKESYIKENNYYNKEISFQGVVAQETDERNLYTNLIVKSDKFNGLVLVKAPVYPQYQYGDLLEIYCLIEKPDKIEDFDYAKYLAISDIYSLCSDPQIKLLGEHKGDIILQNIFALKKYLQNIINKIWTMPSSAFMAGLLLGMKKGLPAEIENDFKSTGTIHILVVSGSHLVVLAAFVRELLKNFYINRKKLFYIIAGVLIFYVVLTGMSAAAVRAALLAILIMLAEKFCRPKATLNILIFSAFLMVIQNPKILVYDTGFQLSFLATVGLVYLSKPMEKVLFFLPQFLGIKNLMAQTLSAIALTNPIIWYQFGRLSLVAPLANLLTVPFINSIMIAGMVAVFLAALIPILGQLAAWLVMLLINLVLFINHWLASLSWASIAAPALSAYWLAAIYLIILGIIYLLNRKDNTHV
ncbi:MAG: ComEC/Rec2 family competence protein [Patescibacteria group bacterium]|jgi:competence protein ComEC